MKHPDRRAPAKQETAVEGMPHVRSAADRVIMNRGKPQPEGRTMKTYEYATVSYRSKDLVLVATSEHRQIIDDYAVRGYRYVDSIITEVDGNARPRKIDLVFEKNAD